jgi:hypothetical protein
MPKVVVYVKASENAPNTDELDRVWEQMTQQNLALAHVSPSQGEGGATAGLWLFFSEPRQATRPNTRLIPTKSSAVRMCNRSRGAGQRR